MNLKSSKLLIPYYKFRKSKMRQLFRIFGNMRIIKIHGAKTVGNDTQKGCACVVNNTIIQL